jgi:hypothetical protein
MSGEPNSSEIGQLQRKSFPSISISLPGVMYVKLKLDILMWKCVKDNRKKCDLEWMW